MSNYTEESKKIYNEVCDKYNHHWLDTTITQTMAMEMITKALAISRVVFNEAENCDKYLKPKRTKPNTIQPLCECYDSEVELCESCQGKGQYYAGTLIGYVNCPDCNE